MNIEGFAVGPFQSNCFILSCSETGKGIIVDAGDDGERVVENVRRLGVDIQYVFNTHAHIDHVCGLATVVRELDVPVYMHSLEEPIYEAVPQQAAMFGLPVPELPSITRWVAAGDMLSVGRHSARTVLMPGHSPGSLSLLFEEASPPVGIMGDVLFQGSIGRTDLPGSDHAQMISTLRDVVMKLPSDMVVYPGHGPETTIGDELRSNPFLLQLA